MGLPVTGAERPSPRRGDWIEIMGSIVLRFYSAPVGRGGGRKIVVLPDPHQYIGPVHDVDDSYLFVSVLVPHPTTGGLAWTNIWSCLRGHGVDYALLVPDEVLSS